MPKKQCNIRMSEGTRVKLDDLTTIYGTQAEAVAVAIHNLWLQERDKDQSILPSANPD